MKLESAPTRVEPFLRNLGITKNRIQRLLSSQKKALAESYQRSIVELVEPILEAHPPQSWESQAKRWIQVEDAQNVALHMARSGVAPSGSAIILSGENTKAAAYPWVITGLATKIILVDKSEWVKRSLEIRARKNFLFGTPNTAAKEEIKRLSQKEVEAKFVGGDIFSRSLQTSPKIRKYSLPISIFDLDFCEHTLHSAKRRQEILSLLDTFWREEATDEGLVLRITGSIGRKYKKEEVLAEA